MNPEFFSNLNKLQLIFSGSIKKNICPKYQHNFRSAIVKSQREFEQ